MPDVVNSCLRNRSCEIPVSDGPILATVDLRWRGLSTFRRLSVSSRCEQRGIQLVESVALVEVCSQDRQQFRLTFVVLDGAGHGRSATEQEARKRLARRNEAFFDFDPVRELLPTAGLERPPRMAGQALEFTASIRGSPTATSRLPASPSARQSTSASNTPVPLTGSSFGSRRRVDQGSSAQQRRRRHEEAVPRRARQEPR